MPTEPLHPAPPANALSTLLMPPGYVAALNADGHIVALPTTDPATPTLPAGEPADAEPEHATMPPIVGQIVVLGSITALAASGALWIAAAALRAVHPVLPDAITALKWSALLVATVVLAVAAAKVRTRTGATFSVFHTTKTTTVGNQTLKGRHNTLNNHF
ncbi:hypothetical protein POF50_019105 [Streptomyces sp. SL13]|uniref:Uncharacterized protein n=1 Tax=Streptantibioticus silvisoli TaxID=2705255 RepID=A0AA90GZZ0_9ACTN|nr:hypothetical protein [Streptantibioticus silvisoli]MDI5971418.1 hypothetical protein [Streptantibioticus silvisoli]